MRIAHRLIAAAVCFCASFLVSAPLFAFSEWYVNTTADSGPGSLRAAILNANANDNGNLIYFVFPGPGITTISPTSPLPVIIGGNQGVEIRGVNLAGTPGVELSGALAPAGTDGLVLQGSGSTVRGLIINGFRRGVVLDGGDTNVVSECYIGTDQQGALVAGNSEDGVAILAGNGHRVSNNVISGNGGNGVSITGSSVASIVSGNLIGTDFQTRYQLPNGGNGVSVSGAGATGTRIGKAVDSLPGNIISGNGGDGVFVGGGATGTFIGGNTIGLSTFGNARIANGGNGVTILAAYNNTIGGPLDSNLISGNTGDGICLCTGSAGTFVGVNVIGVDTLGSHAMGNGGDGIRIAYSAGNHLAGGVDIPGLLIGGNTLNGIRLAGASSTGNEITGAAIGGGLAIPIPNSLNGILIENGASNNKIGLAGVGNVISANLSSGVFISAGSGNEIRTNTIRGNGASGIRIVSGIGNRLTLNRISSNGGLGIDLGAVGVTPNDPDDSDSGPNGLQNFPLVASASAGGIETHVVGSLTSSASTTFRVEFFSSTACDPSAHGEGEVFLGSTDVSTDATGVGLYDAILPVPAFGPFITATATDPVGNTSEFSACALLAGPVLTAISPTSGPAAGGTPVALTGMGFQSTVTVAFGTAAATSPMSSDDQHATAVTPALAPGLLYDVTLTNLDGLSATLPKGWLADFLDVPGSSGLHPFVEKVVRRSIAAGCTGGNFCVSDPVTRAQVAVFLLRAHDGPSYNPPPATGTVFTDVPANGFAAAWIEELATRGVTAGCGGGAYCPGLAMTRAQMAVFLLRAKNGPSYVAPDPTGIFADVPISSPYARWVEELFHEGATAGCGGGNFCPDGPNTRGQMAVFLVTMFGL